MKSGSLVKLSLVLSLALLSSSLSTHSNTTANALPMIQAAAAPRIQVADEITRRLRRIGFNYIHSFGIRPSDLAGDLC